MSALDALAWPFRLHGPVGRAPYAAAGFGLTLLKYLADRYAIERWTDRTWSPREYLSPLLQTREEVLAGAPGWLGLALAAWTLPFLWIGFVLTIRRLLDAGWSPWAALLFFVPLLNYALLLVLCVVPQGDRADFPDEEPPRVVDQRLRSAIVALVLSLAGTGILTLVSIYVLRSYGLSLFFGMPALLGLAAGYVHNAGHPRGVGETLLVAFAGMFIAMGGLLLFALEGLICLAMAAPLLLGAALLGALVGRAFALLCARPGLPGLALAPLFLLTAGGEAQLLPPAEVEVVSAVVVDAPPEVVWEHVVSFSELPPPAWPLFRLGIAYPVRARIDGAGVGAVRHCEFSTGAFVEPITRWEPPRRLAFDVAAQPPPMRELTPYPGIDPPHLDGFVRCRRGEFRLIPLEGGRTRLEGSTWYALEIRPNAYWRPFADLFIARIHRRVLAHVAALSEASAEPGVPD